MDDRKLVKMVNDISRFFEADADVGRARAGVADHLARFWEPRMRRQILAHVDRGGEGLLPLALDAIVAHRERLAPPAA